MDEFEKEFDKILEGICELPKQKEIHAGPERNVENIYDVPGQNSNLVRNWETLVDGYLNFYYDDHEAKRFKDFVAYKTGDHRREKVDNLRCENCKIKLKIISRPDRASWSALDEPIKFHTIQYQDVYCPICGQPFRTYGNTAILKISYERSEQED